MSGIVKNDLMNKFDKKIIINSQFVFLFRKKCFNVLKQNMFVDMHKKSFDIELENISLATMILRARTKKIFYSLDAEMRSFF